MTKQRILSNLLLDTEQELHHAMVKMGNYGQRSGVGDKRENLIREFIRPFLPGCFDLKRGRIIDCKGLISSEFDLIVHHKDYCPYWFEDHWHERVFIPVEAVIATIEIKSRISKKQIENASNALDTLEPMKRFFKCFSHYKRTLPTASHRIFEDGICAFETTQGIEKIIGAIIYFDGLKAATVKKHLLNARAELCITWGIRNREALLKSMGMCVERHMNASILLFWTLLERIACAAERTTMVRPDFEKYSVLIAREMDPRVTEL